MKMRALPGINIQAPWAELLLSSKKAIETRTYPMPTKYVGVEIALIETPGAEGNFVARIIGTIVFGQSYEYPSRKRFEEDYAKHLVDVQHKIFGWPKSGSKWAWPVISILKFDQHYPAPKPRGIVFASECKVPIQPQAASSSRGCITTPASKTRVSIDESSL